MSVGSKEAGSIYREENFLVELSGSERTRGRAALNGSHIRILRLRPRSSASLGYMTLLLEIRYNLAQKITNYLNDPPYYD